MPIESLRSNVKAQSVRTLVPGHKPIDLISFYHHQIDYYPECELQTKRWFVENIKPDWVLFDIGANIGYYSILFSRLVTAGQVFAFEPTETFSMLEKNLTHNGCRNVKSLKIALGMASGAIEDNIYRIWGREPERLTYNFSTVDDLAGDLNLARLDCIKIDVDSFDFEVLIGAEQTLKRFNPWVVVELCHALSKRNQSPPQALEWLMNRGYRSAHVLEHENFVLRRRPDDDDPREPSMLLTFENRPVVLPPLWIKQDPVDDLFASEPALHNRAKIVNATGRRKFVIDAPGPRWAFAVSWSRNDVERDHPYIIEMEIRVTGGAIGIGCVADDFAAYVGAEIEIAPNEAVQTASIFVEEPGAAKHLVVRNVDLAAHEAQVTICGWLCLDAARNALR